jgi:hypothetical protein
LQKEKRGFLVVVVPVKKGFLVLNISLDGEGEEKRLIFENVEVFQFVRLKFSGEHSAYYYELLVPTPFANQLQIAVQIA